MMSCCEVSYGQYILEEGDLSREALDELFGGDNYELTIEKKFQNYRDVVKQYFGKNAIYLKKTNGILIKQMLIMEDGTFLGEKIRKIKFPGLQKIRLYV